MSAQSAERGDGTPPFRWFEVLPVLAPKTSIVSSPLFWPGIFTAIVACVLFVVPSYRPETYPETYFGVVGFYIVGMVVLILYVNSGAKGRLLSLAFAAGLTALILLVPKLLNGYEYVFVDLPGLRQQPTTKTLAAQFGYFFVVAGLMEELLKATPALLMLALGLLVGPRHRLGPFGIRNPMDGILMGCAAGGAFTLVETLRLYVPNWFVAQAGASLAAKTKEMELLLSQQIDPKAAEQLVQLFRFAASKAGINDAFFLLMPRIIGSLAAHIAWAAVFGYFIGLAALYRSKIALLLAIGWLSAAALHGAWDACASVGKVHLLFVLAAASFVALLLYFTKARALSSPNAATAAS